MRYITKEHHCGYWLATSLSGEAQIRTEEGVVASGSKKIIYKLWKTITS